MMSCDMSLCYPCHVTHVTDVILLLSKLGTTLDFGISKIMLYHKTKWSFCGQHYILISKNDGLLYAILMLIIS